MTDAICANAIDGIKMKRDEYARGWRAAALMVLFGLPGVFSILLVLPDIPGVPRAALLVQPLISLVVLALAGAVTAPRVGLRSLLLERAAGRNVSFGHIPWQASAGIGCILGIALATIDAVTAPLWRSASSVMHVVEGWRPALLVTGILYGGITEEIMMRFGVMSGLAGLFSRIAGSTGSGLACWIGNIGAAILFGILHLPAIAAAGTAIDAAIAIRTIGLNAVGGLIYGWLFMRGALEHAMLAHTGTHAGFAVAALGWRAPMP